MRADNCLLFAISNVNPYTCFGQFSRPVLSNNSIMPFKAINWSTLLVYFIRPPVLAKILRGQGGISKAIHQHCMHELVMRPRMKKGANFRPGAVGLKGSRYAHKADARKKATVAASLPEWGSIRGNNDGQC